ncbi:MAG: ornithine carbamoyltransferase [Firmicutes bacterium]|nr:ornithine carbamoyltransferase [Bacillota bacterium]
MHSTDAAGEGALAPALPASLPPVASLPSAPPRSRARALPNTGLRGRDLLTLGDFTPEELVHLLAEALAWKRGERRGLPLTGKTLAMVFRKHSTRTRVSAEVAMAQLGGHALFLHESVTQMARGEPLPDTARVLARYADGILVRTHDHAEVETWAAYADVPVINALTDRDHPCQALADLLTLAEAFGRTGPLAAGRPGFLRGLKLAYVGDGNNVAHALMLGGALAGLHVVVACPEGYGPDAGVTARASELARAAGGAVEVTDDPAVAVSGAHAVYTDVWVSMGEEAEAEARRAALAPYAVTPALMAQARPDAVFLHCLPAHRGEEAAADVIDGPRSAVWDQAENRLHTIKAVLAELL